MAASTSSTAAFKAQAGNPYDGHTVSTAMDQAIALTGSEPERVYVGRDFSEHDYVKEERAFITR